MAKLLIAMPKKIYNKLVRDKIPEIIAQNGNKAVTHIADDQEYQVKLYEKLQEEIAEFEREPSAAELADVLEVIEAIAVLHKLNMTEVKTIQAKKAEERGKFAKKIILEETID